MYGAEAGQDRWGRRADEAHARKRRDKVSPRRPQQGPCLRATTQQWALDSTARSLGATARHAKVWHLKGALSIARCAAHALQAAMGPAQAHASNLNTHRLWAEDAGI